MPVLKQEAALSCKLAPGIGLRYKKLMKTAAYARTA
jgi:hypothetical protein